MAPWKQGTASLQEIRSRGLEDKVRDPGDGLPRVLRPRTVAAIDPLDIFYQQFSADDVPEIVSETIGKGRIVERLAYPHPLTGDRIAHISEIPFYKGQTH